MAKEKKYDTIAKFFYKKASARVKTKVEESQLTHKEILYPDPKQISRIINNKPQRNNPFLINNSALETFYINENYEFVPFGLIRTLDFNSPKEVLWGTNEEISDYIHELFILLWNKVCVQDKLIDSDFYLCDYVPYAKYSTYWKILFESDTINDPRFSFAKYNNRVLNFPALFFGIKEDTIIENIESTREEALEFFYNRCKEDFLSDFIKFTEENSSFHMLNNTIANDLIEKRFLPLIKKYKPDASSLGLRVKNLIYEDLSYCATLVYKRNINNPDYRKQLTNASSDYIISLEKIQKDL